ncbi:hypothetical protein RHMOL_Rhmol11G0150900 [Rhododendron molle]|uniref:Uncharacterized protein n=1 Tax=Rhododendron molle TaxID=49168 RepID=A0ACC0LSR7_RHOML|nr:hypothetical protein RHMOL_Rhmol11G0150900 [Rhododendron molle]
MYGDAGGAWSHRWTLSPAKIAASGGQRRCWGGAMVVEVAGGGDGGGGRQWWRWRRRSPVVVVLAGWSGLSEYEKYHLANKQAELEINFDMFIFDEGAKADQMIRKMSAKFMQLECTDSPHLCGSCIPLTRKKVTIRSPVHPSAVCGFFFHPLLKDYRLLLVHPKGNRFEYFVYSLGSQQWRKLADLSYRPGAFDQPIIMNGALHWRISNEGTKEYHHVMMFNMGTEKFRAMPYSKTEYNKRMRHSYAILLESKGKLANRCNWVGFGGDMVNQINELEW